MEHPESVLEIMHELKGLGVRIALDDFGAGFDSLGYLKKSPFDAMKMDRSYLDGYPHSRQAQSIVEGIIGLGRASSLIMTAEGIDKKEQLGQLGRIDCQQGQGYLLGRPLSPGAVRGLKDKTVS